MIEIVEYCEDEKLWKELSSFCIKNDYLFLDPFSNHVDINGYLRRLITNGRMFIAKINDQIAGVAAAYMNDRTRFIGHLQYLMVAGEHQGTGIGRKLLETVLLCAVESDMKKVILTVDKENDRAINLYRKSGFVDWPVIHDNVKKQYMVKFIDNGYSQYDISQIHSTLKEMGKSIAEILEKNDIPYMLAFGSLLGAVRHKGFIPWDDDFDLFLFSDSNEKAINCLRRDLPDRFFVEYNDNEPDYFYSWAHVKDKNSIAICDEYKQDSIYVHNGLSVDLYVLHEMDTRDLDLFLLKENVAYIERLHKLRLLSDSDYARKRCGLMKSIEEEEKKDNAYHSGEKCFGMTLRERMINIEDVFPLKKYEFEGMQLFGPNNADGILRSFYGEYMQLPPVEQRVPHYSSVKGKKVKYDTF